MSDLSPTLSGALGAHVRELVTAVPLDDQLAHARTRLSQRLAQQRVRGPRQPARGCLALAAASLLAVLMLAISPLAFRSGDAFAAVLRHFQEFKTLSMQIQMGTSGLNVHVLVDRNGNVRTDDPEVSVIVNLEQQGSLVLMHSAHQAMRMPIPAQRALAVPINALTLIEKLKDDKSQAQKLPQTRVIDGREVTGWQVDADGMRTVIWADSDGLPREMEMPDKNITLRYRLGFDDALAADSFSLTPPAGYELVTVDAD